MLSRFSTTPITEVPAYALLTRLAPGWIWESWLLFYGVVQILGLVANNAILRAAGAAGVFLALCCIFLAVVLTDAGTRFLGFCAASLCIEFCAIVFHIAYIVRVRLATARGKIDG